MRPTPISLGDRPTARDSSPARDCCTPCCQRVGGDIGCDAVEGPDVLRFLAGNGPLTRSRANKYGALAGFYRYAISRGHATRSPLPAPDDEPRQPRSAPPYVFSRDELQRLFGAIDISRQRPVQLDAGTLRALPLLLYGAGLRFGEARRPAPFPRSPRAASRHVCRCARAHIHTPRPAGPARPPRSSRAIVHM